MGGPDAHPTRNSLFVEQASCLFLRIVLFGELDPETGSNLLLATGRLTFRGSYFPSFHQLLKAT